MRLNVTPLASAINILTCADPQDIAHTATIEKTPHRLPLADAAQSPGARGVCRV
jgi:hypothetical protein